MTGLQYQLIRRKLLLYILKKAITHLYNETSCVLNLLKLILFHCKCTNNKLLQSFKKKEFYNNTIGYLYSSLSMYFESYILNDFFHFRLKKSFIDPTIT
ncbi:hypothetical protein QTP88_008527 [Uroleucon formosanum]